jgi:prepilin-type N-terminal cleavage/methylation domain-containing protein
MNYPYSVKRIRRSLLPKSAGKRTLFQKHPRGFTIVELLIVIVVIGILAAITIVAYNGVQVRAKDSRRAQDISNIKKALLLYNVNNGGVPNTSTYAGNGPGGWNLSSMPSWLSFLNSSMSGKAPLDPVNTGIVDPNSGYELTYFYYCYAAGSGPLPATPNVQLGYWSESSRSMALSAFPVEQCL